jgi:hypothetical protein
MKKVVLMIILVSFSVLNAGSNKMPPQCKKKIYCSQMKSCKEAKYYLKLCSKYAKMDGDRDGIPCEKQWCQLNRKRY